MPYVYSTASNSAKYCAYDTSQPAGAPALLIKEVLIQGGANIGAKGLQTPLGVATHVSDEDLEFLMNNPAFKRHVAKGHLIVSSNKKDANKVAADMTPTDNSAPQMVDKAVAEASQKLEALEEVEPIKIVAGAGGKKASMRSQSI